MTDGFLCIDKPAGPTSFAIVKKIRHALSIPRIGHSGTLDPLATGLMIIALGKATRLLPYLPAEPKRYDFGLTFGSATETLDSAGKVTADGGRVPSSDEISAVLPKFLGKQAQVPPRFSAVKIGGERAYALARRNEEFEPAPKQIEIHALTLTEYDESRAEARLTVTCSSGTYVRSLARDIAAALGTLGFASLVRRTAVGLFTVKDAVGIDTPPDDLSKRIISINEAFKNFPSIVLSPQQRQNTLHGREVSLNASGRDSMPLFGYDTAGALVAVFTRRAGGIFHPERVFSER